MRGASLKSIRKRSVAMGIGALILVGAAIFAFSMWHFTEDHNASADRILGKMAGEMEERLRMTEAFLRHMSLDGLRESALDAMKVKDMVLCSGDGRVIRTFRGSIRPGLSFPLGLLTEKWEVSSFLAQPASPRMVLSVRRGDFWLVAGFDSRFFFPDPGLLDDPDSSIILINRKGMIIASWGDTRNSPVGGLFPLSLLGSHLSRGTWGGVGVGTHSVRLGPQLSLVQVCPVNGVMFRSAGIAFWWSAMALVVFAPFMGLFWWILYRITEDLGNSVRRISEAAEDISMAESAVESVPRMFAAIEAFRADRTCFEEYDRLLKAFERMLAVISDQGENLTALYEEAIAMEAQVRQSNEELNLANERLDGLMNLSKNVGTSPSLEAAVDGIVSNLADAFRCSFVGVVAFRDETPFMWGSRGIAPFDLGEEGLSELMASFADREEGTVQPFGGYVRTLVPIRFMGHLVGLVVMVQTEQVYGGSLLDVMNRFALPLGGIFHAYGMLREVRKSFHYLATRMQSLTEVYHDETGSHLARVGEYSALVARGLGMPLEYVEDIRIYSQLHDIGKLRIPLEILAKPGALSEEEFAVVRHHTEYGVDILGDSEWLEMARQVALTHHEKWDGSGYPRGLRGDQIPLSGRIVALADIYDALRDARGYKPPFSHEKACGIILEGDGRVQPEHFDPDVLSFFRSNHEKFRSIYEEIRDDEN